MAKAKTKAVARSAVSGRFVSTSYANRHPRTTVVHRVKKGK